MEPAERTGRETGQTWAVAVLGSVLLHALAAGLLVRLDFRPLPRPRQVVAVEPLTLTEGLPGRRGGGGEKAEKKVTLPPPPPPVDRPKEVRPRRQPVPRPQPEAPPPELALPTPVKAPPLAAPPPAPAAPTPTGQITAGLPGKETGTGSGAGTGTGTGVGPGTGTGAGGVGGGTGTALKDYLQQVRRLLDQHKHYPALARRQHLEGVVVLQFTIHADGRIENPRLKRSSGHALLDEEAQETVRRVKAFPPFPPGLGRERLTIEIPLAFRLISG